jgi:hypothetical protein
MRFLAAEEPDEPWNRTTLCAFHPSPRRSSSRWASGTFRSGDVRIA